MRDAIAAALFLATLPLAAQSSAPERLIASELAGSQAYETLSHLTDQIGARPSGSKSAALAVAWTTERFRSWGISVRNEPVRVPHWVRGAESATIVSHNDQHLILTALGGSVATPPKGITAEVVEVNSFDELNALGSKVKGRIVYYNNPMDMALVNARRSFEAYSRAVIFRAEGASRAAAYGAVAVLIRSVASASLRSPHTGTVRYDTKVAKIPAAALTVEDAMLVHRLVARGDRVRIHLNLQSKALPEVDSANVIAEIRGERKNRRRSSSSAGTSTPGTSVRAPSTTDRAWPW